MIHYEEGVRLPHSHSEESLTELKYPPNATVTSLNSTLEIKRVWLHSEWAPECQFSRYICPSFPERRALAADNKNINTELIQSVFHNVRGKFALWGSLREEGRWKKVVVLELSLDWVTNNVHILYPAQERFSVSELNGIVLWRDKSSGEKRYQLHEGNHRISAWLAAQSPRCLPATLFIGKPKKPV
ncbi:MAG: hypothetical protein JSR46_04110 [Verrucomicrobia bacterium]|nr:hypothetical protein [Verrucomicrobiota bacterium]